MCRSSNILLVTAVLFALASPTVSLAQPRAETSPTLPRASIAIPLAKVKPDSLIRLPHRFIVEGSDTVTLSGARVLVAGTDYRLDNSAGTIRLDSAFAGRRDTLVVTYRYLPLQFQEKYYRRTLVILPDTTTADTIKVARPPASFDAESIFGPNLQKSGSLVRGFTVGTNRDLSPTSGLRLQLAGQLAPDLEVAASLTDENTPIQPEGTTQSLQEFDRVVVEIKSTDLGATLGDFVLNVEGTEFGRISRKLQGAQGTARYGLLGTNNTALISGAITRGKFNTNQFNGVEGVQGPYRLAGRNGETQIIILAGTERVYVNGEPQIRGEVNDYTIDYSLGELTFSSRRLITSASRIVVDFEYSDRQYARSLVGGKATSSMFGDRAALSVSYFREADDPDSPLEDALSDSARAIIAGAGADRNKAVVSGATEVDSNGIYIRVDTLLSGNVAYTLYRYAPGDSAALYIVRFSYVGGGKGDYVRQQLGVFRWVGVGQGDYLPVRFLPIPQGHQLLDVALNAKPLPELTVGAEFGRSVFDANRLSTLDDASSGGDAYHLTASYAPRSIRLAGLDLGDLDLKLRERYTQASFVPLDRTNEIEFLRKWGIDSLRSESEEIREASLRYAPAKGVAMGGGYGSNERGADFSARRWDAMAALQGEDRPVGNYYVENISSDDANLDNASRWLRQKGALEYTMGKFLPGIGYEAEDRRISSYATGVLKPGSFSFDQFGGGLRVRELGNLSLGAEYVWRLDDAFQLGEVVPEAESFQQSYTVRLESWKDLSTSFDVTLRQKNFTQQFEQTGSSDIKTVLVRNLTRYTPFERGVEADLYYEGSTERSARLQRVFIRVAPGTGNYRYLGDLNNNGIAEESEFEQVRFDGDFVAATLPTEQLYPVVNLRTSLRLRITPRRFLKSPAGFAENALAAISTETYVRIDEKSTLEDVARIYFLDLSEFQNDSTTITGSSIFTQDLYLFENRPEFSARVRFNERRGLASLSTGAERGYGRERSVRLRWQLVPEIANQLDLINRTDNVSAPENSSRARDIEANTLSFDFSYRPRQEIEYGFALQVGRSTDSHPEPDVVADLNTQSSRFVYSFEGAGQLRAVLSREEVLLDRSVSTFAYELTGGKPEGITWLWGLGFDYRITSFIQATLNYDGRTNQGLPVIHTGRAEVRAFF